MKPFFIGWRGLPRALYRHMGLVLLALAAIDIGLAAALCFAQPPRRTGFWDPAGETVFTGALVKAPYPMVRVPASGTAPAATILLVGNWKFGVPLGPELQEGDEVRVAGYAIRRGDVTVLQVEGAPKKLGRSPSLPPLVAIGAATLTGEIVDSKCWAGAMNPGDGMEHMGCGSLCLLGGIPALFIAAGEDGTTRWYVIADEQGRSLGEGLRVRLGARLTLRGTIFAAHDLHEFRVDTAALAL